MIDEITAFATPSNGTIISVSRDRAIRVWDLNSQALSYEILETHAGLVFNNSINW